MKTTINQCSFLALALGATLSVTAQAALQGSASARVIRDSHGVRLQDGVWQAVGPAFKARLDREGMEFTPALGERAPRSMPLRYAFDTASRGETVLARAGGEDPVAGSADGPEVEYRRGAIVERFDVSSAGIEVSYVFPTRPEGSGDLVVRGRIATDLDRPADGVSDEGLTFSLPGFGGVKIGGVTGLDANGDSVPGSLRLEGDVLEMTLPSAFVDAATYPLVLDPLIGTDITIRDVQNVGAPVAAYDVTEDLFLVAWELRISGDDIDVVARRMLPDGSAYGGILFLATTALIERRPTISNVNARNRFVVAWERSGSVFGPYQIEARSVAAINGLQAAKTILVDAPGFGRHPCLANEAGLVHNGTLLAWTAPNAGIRLARVNVATDGTLSMPNPPTVVSPNQFDSEPTMSNGGTSGRHVVLYEREITSVHVYGVIADRNATILTTTFPIANHALLDQHSPTVDGDGDDWLVLHQVEESAGSADSDIIATKVNWGGGLWGVLAPVVVAGTPGVDERTPAIGWCGRKYLAAWSEEAGPGVIDYDIKVRALSPDNCQSCGITQSVSASSPVLSLEPVIATQRSAGSVGDLALVVYSLADLAPPFASEVHGHLYEALGPGGTVQHVQRGCVGGGDCDVTGSFALAGSVNVTLNQADVTASVAALHFGTPASAIIPCGGCPVMTPFLAVPAPIAGGSALVNLPLNCDVGMVGQTLRFQYVVANTSTLTCLNLPVALSSIVEATVGL